MRKTLFDQLKEYGQSDRIPFHMPGHKRNPRYGFPEDITEVEGFDDLHHPQGILLEIMARAQALWHSENSFLLVNGSTCGILAGIRAATHYGDTVLVARNCHKSVYHAIELCGLKPHYLLPPVDASFGLFGSVTPSMVEEALAMEDKTALVILTSPTYEGVLSDIEGIVKAAHGHGVPVLVDQAHGAHLGFSSYFPGSAVEAGADITVQSLHKTLPSVTQTALCHVNGSLVAAKDVMRELNVFEASSPSYLLMASMDRCFAFLEEEPELFSHWEELLRGFSFSMAALRHLRVLCMGKDTLRDHPTFFGLDPSKLVISTKNTHYSAVALGKELREHYRIETEMIGLDYIVAMTGAGDTEAAMSALASSLLVIDAGLETTEAVLPPLAVSLPEMVYPASAAREMACEILSLAQCKGRVSAAYLWAYPPGIPLVVPGERIEEELLTLVTAMTEKGVNLIASKGNGISDLGVLK